MSLKYSLYFFVGTTILYIVSAGRVKQGPYESMMLSINNHCENVTLPYEKNPTMSVQMYLYNTTEEVNLVGANISVYKTVKDLQGTAKIYFGDRKVPACILSNLNCRSVLVSALLSYLGNKDDVCTIKKGAYKFKGLSLNHLQHLFRKRMPYETMFVRTEVTAHDETLACWEYYSISFPLPNKHKTISAN